MTVEDIQRLLRERAEEEKAKSKEGDKAEAV